MHLAKWNVDLFLTRKREKRACKKRRVALLAKLARARAKLHSHAKAVVFGPTSVIASLLSQVAQTPLPMPQTSLHLKIPSTFSMLSEPDQVLSTVCSFARTHKDKSISDVFVNLEGVKEQDLGAHALLDKLVEEMVVQTKFQGVRMGWKGNFPEDPARKRFVMAMGIIRQLGLTDRYLKLNEAEKIHLFERRCRHYIRQVKPINPEDKSAQANAAQRFVEHVSKCLAREGRDLTNEGRSKLCSYVVEVIDNAENHAGMVDWTIQGYVDMAMVEPQCEIVVFNFGKSIAETLEELPADSYTMKQIQKYLELHSTNGWFSHKWRREDLLTLIALQGSVSSKNDSENSTRGQGTADLIEFFQQINDERAVEGNSTASMYIVSGSTRILFDPKYRLIKDSDGRRIIAFNQANDLNEPPDGTCVMPLKSGSRLPGTMIGIKFAVRLGLTRPVVEVPESNK